MSGADIRRLRRDTLVLSQTEFAELLGTTQDLISRWERGVTVPSIRFERALRALAAEVYSGRNARYDQEAAAASG